MLIELIIINMKVKLTLYIIAQPSFLLQISSTSIMALTLLEQVWFI